MQTEYWFEYDEPTGNGRIEAEIRRRYWTDSDSRPPKEDVRAGTVPADILGMIEGHEYQDEDGRLLLSAMDAEERDPIESVFEDYDAGDHIRHLIDQGCSPSEAIDYWFVDIEGFTQLAWAEIRDVSQQTVSENVLNAREKATGD